MTETVLSLQGIAKSYGPLRALDRVDFSLRRGEVRALMGRNGAGKSTLVRLISGAEWPDAGQIILSGARVDFRSPADAIAAGIATVHQELTIVPGLSVAENILLGRWPSRAGTIRLNDMRETARATLVRLGSAIAPDREAGSLSIAQQQIVEIARALARDPRVLILDEPTSSLPGKEVEGLLATVRRLAAQGVAVIYVSHRMDEIGRVADAITVLRDGRIVADLPVSEAPPRRIADLMTGGEISAEAALRPALPRAETALGVRGLAAGALADIDLEIRAGEIVGLAGLLGAGRSELLRAIAGLDRRRVGEVSVFGEPVVRGGVRAALAAGIALVPEDRKAEGLVLDLPIRHNLVMSCLAEVARFGVLDGGAERRIAGASRDTTSIKAADLSLPVSTLSGGNQQKVVVARCINSGARVLLLDEPTRGVDVHAKGQIYELIRRFSEAGGAVLMVSSEYEELLMLSHRILLLRNSRLAGELRPETTDMAGLMGKLLAPCAMEAA